MNTPVRHLSLAGALFLALAGLPACADEPACGLVSTFAHPPETRDLYPARIDAINGKNLVKRDQFPLKPGTYTFKVYEHITAPELMVRPRQRGYSKPLVLSVEAGKTYAVAARFVRDRKTDAKAFWEPVVWEVHDSQAPCHSPLAVPEQAKP